MTLGGDGGGGAGFDNFVEVNLDSDTYYSHYFEKNDTNNSRINKNNEKISPPQITTTTKAGKL